MSSRKSLNVIEIQQPCPADWEAMQGDDRARFCTHCQKNVYNLSAMTADDAQALICQSAGNLCARFARSETGEVLTLDYEPIKRRSRLRRLLLGAGALLTSAASVVAFVLDRPGTPIKTASLRLEHAPSRIFPATQPTYVMGDIAMPTVPPLPVTRPAQQLMGKIACPSVPPARLPQQPTADKAAAK